MQRNAAVWEDLEWGLDLGAETIGEAGRGHVAVQGNRHLEDDFPLETRHVQQTTPSYEEDA